MGTCPQFRLINSSYQSPSSLFFLIIRRSSCSKASEISDVLVRSSLHLHRKCECGYECECEFLRNPSRNKFRIRKKNFLSLPLHIFIAENKRGIKQGEGTTLDKVKVSFVTPCATNNRVFRFQKLKFFQLLCLLLPIN